MGEEITKTRFAPEDFVAFQRRLQIETDLLGELVAGCACSESGFVLGFEIEAWLLDHGFFPNPINKDFLAKLGNKQVISELSRFNVEFTCEPLPLESGVFRRAVAEFEGLLAASNKVAHGLDANLVLIGTLPTLRESDLTLENMSPLRRYAALNSEVMRQRQGNPLRFDIAGRDHFVAEHRDVMLEAAATSFQVHLKTPTALAHRYVNASMMASGPLLAASVNAPFLFGRSLWEETRIPVFEQAIDLAGADPRTKRVTFGSGYLKHSLFEMLRENIENYPVLLPLLYDLPPEKFRHLQLHNGTVWRWNRPLIGFESDGTPHIRFEQRSFPAGPSLLDMIANAAAHIGLIHHFVAHDFDMGSALPFEDARTNFYAAARHGIDASLTWPSAGAIKPARLLLDTLLPAARDGLVALGIDAAEADHFIGIVAARVSASQTGAAWQRASFEHNDRDVFRLMATYCERQRSGAPVHEWSP